jgi:hypothetical protein
MVTAFSGRKSRRLAGLFSAGAYPSGAGAADVRSAGLVGARRGRDSKPGAVGSDRRQ